jgi:hypothetical protein
MRVLLLMLMVKSNGVVSGAMVRYEIACSKTTWTHIIYLHAMAATDLAMYDAISTKNERMLKTNFCRSYHYFEMPV